MINKLFLTLFLILLTPKLIYAAENSVETNFTKIKIFTPWGYPGPVVDSKLTINHEENGSCWTGSLANPRLDAWRCSTENHRIYDPCFSGSTVNNAGDKLICIKSPWNKEATLLTLTKPLPNEKVDTKDHLKDHNPWAIELFDGTRCVYDLTGAAGGVADIPSHATCKSNHVNAFDLIDRDRKIWLVFISKEGNDLPALEQAPIKTAWY
jgi:hypothetical protein